MRSGARTCPLQSMCWPFLWYIYFFFSSSENHVNGKYKHRNECNEIKSADSRIESKINKISVIRFEIFDSIFFLFENEKKIKGKNHSKNPNYFQQSTPFNDEQSILPFLLWRRSNYCYFRFVGEWMSKLKCFHICCYISVHIFPLGYSRSGFSRPCSIELYIRARIHIHNSSGIACFMPLEFCPTPFGLVYQSLSA